jgi:mannose-6-phosphate isomerase-like protein (cupin superfamily)
MIAVRRLDRTKLLPEDGLETQRLLPWPALNAPFEAAWCVVRPGGASVPHAHPEHEIFVAVSGRAMLEVDGERTELREGDVAYFRPGATHRVVNEGDEDFQMYAVWWDAWTTKRFNERQRTEG